MYFNPVILDQHIWKQMWCTILNVSLRHAIIACLRATFEWKCLYCIGLAKSWYGLIYHTVQPWIPLSRNMGWKGVNPRLVVSLSNIFLIWLGNVEKVFTRSAPQVSPIPMVFGNPGLATPEVVLDSISSCMCCVEIYTNMRHGMINSLSWSVRTTQLSSDCYHCTPGRYTMKQTSGVSPDPVDK